MDEHPEERTEKTEEAPRDNEKQRTRRFIGSFSHSLDPALNRYLEQFYALSYDGQTCDGQGRVLLPANIRQKILGEERDVEITGANDHIRVVAETVSRDSWTQFNNELPSLLEMIAGLEKKETPET